MDYNAIRSSWDKEIYSTPLDKLPMKKNLDKFRGCLIGGAAGDALGYTIEFFDEILDLGLGGVETLDLGL
jgi:hypothetical protein